MDTMGPRAYNPNVFISRSFAGPRATDQTDRLRDGSVRCFFDFP